MGRKTILFTLLALLGVALAGCGGGGVTTNKLAETSGSGTGRARIIVQWPTAGSTRVIPAATNSISIEFRNGDVLRKGVIARPDSTLVLEGLPAGKSTFRAYAYSGTGGAGDLLASGEVQFTIKSASESPGGNNVAITLSEVAPPVTDDKYTLGGVAVLDPATPDYVQATLNAIISRSDHKPLEGLTDSNFRVFEDGIERKPVTVAPLSTTTSKADVAFIIDTTGSMSEEIAGVRDSVIAFADTLKASKVDVRFSGVAFGDEVRPGTPFTADVTAFNSWVAGLTADGGGDTPENPLDATLASLNYDWRPDAQHIIVVLTDAPAHQADSVTSQTINAVGATLLGNYVVHTISPEGTRAAHSTSNYPSGNAPASLPGVTRDPSEDVKRLAEITGGVAAILPVDGNVDLTKLPIGDAILKGYIVRFRAPRSDRDHHVRILLTVDGVDVSDQIFNTHY